MSMRRLSANQPFEHAYATHIQFRQADAGELLAVGTDFLASREAHPAIPREQVVAQIDYAHFDSRGDAGRCMCGG